MYKVGVVVCNTFFCLLSFTVASKDSTMLLNFFYPFSMSIAVNGCLCIFALFISSGNACKWKLGKEKRCCSFLLIFLTCYGSDKQKC